MISARCAQVKAHAVLERQQLLAKDLKERRRTHVRYGISPLHTPEPPPRLELALGDDDLVAWVRRDLGDEFLALTAVPRRGPRSPGSGRCRACGIGVASGRRRSCGRARTSLTGTRRPHRFPPTKIASAPTCIANSLTRGRQSGSARHQFRTGEASLVGHQFRRN